MFTCDYVSESQKLGNFLGRFNASWNIYFLVVNGQSFFVIDSYQLNSYYKFLLPNPPIDH